MAASSLSGGRFSGRTVIVTGAGEASVGMDALKRDDDTEAARIGVNAPKENRKPNFRKHAK